MKVFSHHKTNEKFPGDNMAEQSKNDVESLKKMLNNKMQNSNSGGGSVKDQVKAALLKNKAKAQSPNPVQDPNPGMGMNMNNASAPSSAQNSAQGYNSPSASGADPSPIFSKIEQTVNSINEVHSTMESLNSNMNMFVDLFQRRGGSLSSGGEAATSSGNSSGASSVNQMAGNMGQGQNAVTSLLLSNLLKKKDEDAGQKLSELQKGSQAYLDLLIQKLQKFQHEYELLQYLFAPKMLGVDLETTNDAQGNSAWLAGFMSMMMNKKN